MKFTALNPEARCRVRDRKYSTSRAPRSGIKQLHLFWVLSLCLQSGALVSKALLACMFSHVSFETRPMQVNDTKCILAIAETYTGQQVASSGCLSYRCLSMVFNQFAHFDLWPLATPGYFPPERCPLLDIFCLGKFSPTTVLTTLTVFTSPSSPIWPSLWTSASRLHRSPKRTEQLPCDWLVLMSNRTSFRSSQILNWLYL